MIDVLLQHAFQSRVRYRGGKPMGQSSAAASVTMRRTIE
jgi:hypothetical protein